MCVWRGVFDNFSTAELAGVAERRHPFHVESVTGILYLAKGLGLRSTLGALGPAIPHWLDLQDRGFPWQLPAAFQAPDPEDH